jgi:hypothetical protein
MQTRDNSFRERRRFLQQAMAAGGAGILVAFAADEEGAGDVQTDKPVGADAPGGQGYRLTEHILAYYDTARS